MMLGALWQNITTTTIVIGCFLTGIEAQHA